MKLVVLTDIHAANRPSEEMLAGTNRNHTLAAELAGRAVEDARRRGGFDAVAVLGDLVKDAGAPDAAESLAAVLGRIEQTVGDAPLIYVRGNHDPDGVAWPGPHQQMQICRVAGVQLVAFADLWDQQDRCHRPAEQLTALEKMDRSAGPIIALQHNPLAPPIEDEYPYMPQNRGQILSAYRRAGVLCSLSGHYHPGQGLHEMDGTWYATLPAICDRPFTYGLLEVRGETVRLELRQLADLPARPVDSHVHTEMAYCGGGITAAAAVKRAEQLGLGGLILTEHAPQLYCDADDFWRGRHIAEPNIWRSRDHLRIEEYFELVQPLRDGFCRVGLEVELDEAGDLTLRGQDRTRCDAILGAIHWLPGQADLQTEAQEVRAFLRTCEGLCQGDIDVLAHPMRWLQLRGNSRIAEARGPLARMLAETGTATEINCHKDPPDEPFLAACLQAGCRVALASDAHVPEAVGLLGANLEILTRNLDGPGAAEVMAFAGPAPRR